MIEVLNFHSHSERNITIYVKEKTDNYLMIGNSYIVNVTQVTILSYSEKSEASPSMATVIGIEWGELSYSKETSLHLLSYLTLKATENFYNWESISDQEKQDVNTTHFIFMIARSSFKMHNINLKTEYEDDSKNVYFFYPNYLQQKMITLTSLNINIAGTILVTYDPLSLYVENVSVDYYQNKGGISLQIKWNYPDADLNGLIYVNNFTLYFSEERTNKDDQFEMLYYQGPGSFVINNFTSDIYLENTLTRAVVTIVTNLLWMPETSTPRYFNVTNADINLNKNWWNCHNSIGAMTFLETNRATHAYFENITATNYLYTNQPAVFLIGNSLSDHTMKNMYIINSVETEEDYVYNKIYLVSHYSEVIIANIIFNNDLYYGEMAIEVWLWSQITLNNAYFSKINAASELFKGVLYLDTIENGSISISNLTFLNSNIEKKDIVFSGTEDLTLEDITFSNITVDVDVSLLKADLLHNFIFKTITFKEIYQKDQSDSSNLMISIEAADLNSTGVFLIQDISITESSVSLLNLKQIINSEMNGRTLQINNLSYKDSVIPYEQDLVVFDSFKTEGDFQILIENVTMTSLNFTRMGFMFKFTQQTTMPVLMKNCYFYNNYGSSIYIESADTFDTSIQTKIEMTNITAENITPYLNSFIHINQGGNLAIYDSLFKRIDNIDRGAVLNAGYQNSVTTVYNTRFEK